MPGISDRYLVSRAVRRRSLRFALALPILIPALALTGLWGYAATGFAEEGLRLRAEANLAASTGRSAHTVLTSLQDERRLTAVWQAAPTEPSRTALVAARNNTDTAVRELRTAHSSPGSASAAVKGRAESLSEALQKLPQQREAIDRRALTGTKAFQYYTDTTAAGVDLLKAATRTDDGRLARGAAAVTSLVQSSEMLSREEALLFSALPSGRITSTARKDFADFAHYFALQQQTSTAPDPRDLPEDEARAYQRITGSPQWALLLSVEDAVAGGTTALPEQAPAKALPRQADKWREAAYTTGKDLRQLGSDTLGSVTQDGSARAEALLLRAAVGTLVALTALVVTGVLALRFARSLTVRLARLHHTTVELADTRLPQLVEQLGRGEVADPAEQPPDREYGPDQLGELAAATHHLKQAVEVTLVQQARGREGTEQVFLGLARRTQVLINRLIPKLDELERKHHDSKLLKDIFAVDHLATRVRRHTENLLILGGSPPVRRWSKPVPIYEVLRSAISETEDYRRVEALPGPQVSLVGRAVADVVHLLAELIENGTAFSPPETKVSVSAKKVAKGLALEVEDRGLGLPDEEKYESINKLLADSPKLDMMTLGEAPRLGLFVVARLAKRHGLEVSLRKSPYGGTLAIVLLSSTLLEETPSLLSGIIPELPRTVRATTTATATAGAGDSDGAITQPALVDHSGYPAYGGAGLLPSTPQTLGIPAPRSEDSHTPAARTHSSPDEPTEAGDETTSAGSRASQGLPARVPAAGRLPQRVRGQSLAEPLRKEPYSPPEQDDKDLVGDALSPDRAGATMAAIQSANKRARTARAAEPADGHHPLAETPPQRRTGGSVRKDQ